LSRIVFDDLLDAGRDLLAGSAAAVVRADHEHDELGLDAFELAVLDPPQHVLRAVAADAEVGRLVLAEVLSQISFWLFQPAVIESPRKSRSMSPFFACATKSSCIFMNFSSASPVLR
jgi:hypothetical protein